MFSYKNRDLVTIMKEIFLQGQSYMSAISGHVDKRSNSQMTKTENYLTNIIKHYLQLT